MMESTSNSQSSLSVSSDKKAHDRKRKYHDSRTSVESNALASIDNVFGPSTSTNFVQSTMDHSIDASSGFQESIESLNARRDLIIDTCKQKESLILEYMQKIKNHLNDMDEAKSDIQKLDKDVERLTMENKRQKREILRSEYYKKIDWIFTNEACPVCLEHYNPNVLYDSCRHSICINCNKSLLKAMQLPTCPLCRTEITSYVKFNEKKLRIERTRRVFNYMGPTHSATTADDDVVTATTTTATVATRRQ